jgi:hypothetical protein
MGTISCAIHHIYVALPRCGGDSAHGSVKALFIKLASTGFYSSYEYIVSRMNCNGK